MNSDPFKIKPCDKDPICQPGTALYHFSVIDKISFSKITHRTGYPVLKVKVEVTRLLCVISDQK